ncbi:MAG: hypothetical protein AB7T59_13760 [Hyphomonadaceae bacterium]
MRRVLLTLFLAFAVAAGGFITVSAAATCPILSQAPAHDCCPDQGPADDGDAPGKSAMDCALMQLCRAAPAVATEAADPSAPISIVMTEAAPLIQAAPRLASVDGVFRPPRSH